ncbi:hypothetical protein IC582_009770 [Cucumis melo]
MQIKFFFPNIHVETSCSILFVPFLKQSFMSLVIISMRIFVITQKFFVSFFVGFVIDLYTRIYVSIPVVLRGSADLIQTFS